MRQIEKHGRLKPSYINNYVKCKGSKQSFKKQRNNIQLYVVSKYFSSNIKTT